MHEGPLEGISRAQRRMEEEDRRERLRKAAPLLLEALINMAALAESEGWGKATTGRQLILKDAKAAIARAEGREP